MSNYTPFGGVQTTSQNYNGLPTNGDQIQINHVGKAVSLFVNAAAEYRPSVFNPFFNPLQMNESRGRELSKIIYMPVMDNRNIGGFGRGNNFNEETGTFDVDAEGNGLGTGAQLKTKHFSYYIGQRRYDVNSAAVLNETNTVFASSLASSAFSAVTDLDSLGTALATGGVSRVLDDKDNEYGFLGVIIEKDTDGSDGASKTAKIAKFTVPSNSTIATSSSAEITVTLDGTDKTVSLGSSAGGTPSDIATAIATGLNSGFGVDYTVSAEGSSVFIEDTKGTLSDFTASVSVSGTGTGDKLVINKVSVVRDFEIEEEGETYTAYSIGGTRGAIVELASGLTEGSTYSDPEGLEDPYLRAAIENAKMFGYLESATQGTGDIRDIRVPLAKTMLDTLQIIDSRVNPDIPYIHSGAYNNGATYDSTYSSELAGKGKVGFGFNISSLVNVRNISGIYAVYQDRPVGNAGGHFRDYYNIVDNIPVIGDNTGEANVVNMQRIEVNGTIFQMGRMFKLSEDELLFSDFGIMDPRSLSEGTKGFSASKIKLKTDALYATILQDQETAYQLDIINNAGVTFYSGDAYTMKGITKPLTAKLLKQVATRLKDNKAEPDRGIFGGSQNYGTTPIASSYLALADHRVISTLSNIASKNVNDHTNSWRPAELYKGAGLENTGGRSLLTEEQGALGQFRFLQLHPQTEIIYHGAGGKPAKNMYYDSEMNVKEFDSWTDAEAAGYRNNVSEDFKADAFGNLDLHLIYIIGKDAISTIKLGGRQKITTKVHIPAGMDSSREANPFDPWGKRGFIASSWWHGTIADYPDRIVKIYLPVHK
jgi:N4-gp56 family major capsid protein